MLNIFKPKNQRRAEKILDQYNKDKRPFTAHYYKTKSEKKWPDNEYRILERIIEEKLLPKEDSITLAGVARTASTYIICCAGGALIGTSSVSQEGKERCALESAKEFAKYMSESCKQKKKIGDKMRNDEIQEFAKKIYEMWIKIKPTYLSF